MASTFGAKGLAWIAFREDGSINSPIVKFFSDEEMAALRERMNVEPGDLVMFAAGPRLLSDEILGGMRSHMANALEIKREGHDFLWVVNFPLFHWDEDRKAYAAEHQPFTLPTETDIAKIEADPLAAGSCTYDFVMDGFEAGGGGMRIHNAEMQMSMLKLLALPRSAPSRSLASSWRRSSLVRPRWAVLPWVWTACACCLPAPILSATSWRSPRRPAAPTSCRAPRVPFPAPSSRTSACA